MKYRVFFFVLFMLNCLSGYSQITADFERASFNQFVKKLENITDFTFYFEQSEVDSVVISCSFQNISLEQALRKAFVNMDLQFSIDQYQKNIFITKDIIIQTELPKDFFEDKKHKSFEQQVIVADAYKEAKGFSKQGNFYEIGIKTNVIKVGEATVTGKIVDRETGEPIVGASIFTKDRKKGASSSSAGLYSITLTNGYHVLQCSAIGYENILREIILYSNGRLDISLQTEALSLDEVLIESERGIDVKSTQMGTNRIELATIKKVPMVMGEPDIMRTMATFPGVKTVGEASTGFNVRGGAVDQNLILFNDGVIFNPSHLFGFFSAFNSDVVSGVELYKSAIPSKYGGRLSSVLNVSPKYGNKEKVEGSVGVGLLTSRIAVGGSIDKGQKATFIVGARTTYSDWLLNLLHNKEFEKSRASFNDLSLGFTYEINDKNVLYLTGYNSNDKFKLRSDTAYYYQNRDFVLKWKRMSNDKFFGTYTAAWSKYKYQISAKENPINAFQMNFDINAVNLKADYYYSFNNRNQLSFGIGSIYHKINPGAYLPAGDSSEVMENRMDREQAMESSLYIEDSFDFSERLSFTGGIRFTRFDYLGPRDTYTYTNPHEKTDENILDTISFSHNEIIKTYQYPEVRLSTRYLFSDDLSIKFSFNTLHQYIHMLSNTTSVSPTDIWKLSDRNLKPQFGNQLALGLYKNFKHKFELSIETYYKKIENYLDYRGGAQLLLNPNIETEVVNTRGKAYGIELYIKKKVGKFKGWVSYTYSRTLLKNSNDNVEGGINDGNWYPANFDKPHDMTFIGNYQFSHRFNIGFNTTYSTGRPITLPIGRFDYAGGGRVLYSDRNQYRVPNYFRLDFSMNIDGNHKLRQKTHNSWNIGVYNITGRKNVYSTYFVSENGRINGYKLSIFGSAIPYVNFVIKF